MVEELRAEMEAATAAEIEEKVALPGPRRGNMPR